MPRPPKKNAGGAPRPGVTVERFSPVERGVPKAAFSRGGMQGAGSARGRQLVEAGHAQHAQMQKERARHAGAVMGNVFAASLATAPSPRSRADEYGVSPSKRFRGEGGVRELSSQTAMGGKENATVTPSAPHRGSSRESASFYDHDRNRDRARSDSPPPIVATGQVKSYVDNMLTGAPPTDASSFAIMQASQGPHAQPAPSKHNKPGSTSLSRISGDTFWRKHQLNKGQSTHGKLSALSWWGSVSKDKGVTAPGSTEGFRNLGNTCYINAGLQALLGLTPFAADLAAEIKRRGGKVDGSDRTLTAAILGVYEQMQRASTRKGTMDASRVARAVSKVFAGKRQEDVHEFVGYCLDTLDEEGTAAAKRLKATEEIPEDGAASAVGHMGRAGSAVADDNDDDVVEVTPAPPQTVLDVPSPRGDRESPVLINDSDDDQDEEISAAADPDSRATATAASCDEGDDDVDFTSGDLAAINGLEAEALAKLGWNPNTIANRNFGCEILQSRRCENASCPSVTNPIKDFFRIISLDLPTTVAAEPVSVQELVEGFFASVTVEYACDACDAMKSMIDLSISHLPRVMCLHIKRFAPGGGKVQSPIRIDRFVSMDFCCGPGTAVPPDAGLTRTALAEAASVAAAAAKGSDSSAAAASAGSTSVAGKDRSAPDDATRKRLDFGGAGSAAPTMSAKEKEKKDLETAIAASLRDHHAKDPSTMTEEEQLQWAMLESTKDAADGPDPEETPWRGGDHNGGPTEPSGAFPYRLVSMIRHVGASASSGHYVCDVWNPKTKSWKECVVAPFLSFFLSLLR